MSNFIENTGVRVVPALISLCMLIWFAIPFTRGIVNIGNISGVAVSGACLVIFIMFRPFTALVKRMWENPAGKIIVSAVTALSIVCVLAALIISIFMVRTMNDRPKNDRTTLVVLGCQVKNGKPSRMLKSRLDTAYEYLSEHDTVNVVVSGGQGNDELISEAQCMRDYLVEKGISSERIFMEDKSANTEENLRFSLELIEKNGLCSDITIVTDGFHQLRAELIAKKLGAGPNNIPAPTRWYLFPTYWVREWFGNVYFIISG
ncbi:MAG: YdcF family protein [Ruminococcus sp.]|nr:YdcF family protein [Ruminococcus sp.]